MSLSLSGTDGVVGAGFTLDSSGASVTAGVGTFGTLNVDDKIIHTADTDTAIRFPESNHISMETGGNERIRIKGNGNIGFGTDNPNNLIHSYGGQIKAQSSTDDTSTNVDLIRAQCGSTGNALFSVRAADAADNNSDWDIKTNAGEELSFTIGGAAEKARITSDGKIGIGTTTPSTTVDAIGTVRATSFTATQPEYLRVAHTDNSHNQTRTDNSTVTVQFGSAYDDTKSGWTSGASNYYTTQEAGYFLISTQAVITSNTANSLREWVLGVEQSADNGSSYSVLMVSGGRGGGNDNTDTDTVTPSVTMVQYLPAGRRIRVRAYANTDGGTWQVDEDLGDPLSGDYGASEGFDNQKGTRLFIVRLF